VTARADVVLGVADHAFLVDHEGRAHQAFAAHALGLLLLDHAVLAAHLALGIRKQADGHAVAVAEVGVRQAVVARDPQHHAVVLDELVLVVGEIGGDQGAAGRAVLRIEIQDNMLLALERRQVHRLHVSVGKLERRRGLSGFQHGASILCSLFFKTQDRRL
jgi:hypothetical protein